MAAEDSPTVTARRARLAAWIKDHHGNRQVDFVAKTKINQGELSLLINGGKSFGEKKAAALEKAAGMPDGYLVYPLPVLSQAESQAERPNFEMIASAVTVLSEYLELVGDPPEWVRDPVLLETAYAVAEEFGRPVGAENVLDLTKILAKRIRGEVQNGAQGAARRTRATAGG